MAKVAIGKTNAARLLDSLGLDYEIREYECDENLDAIHVAQSIGMDIADVYKTIVCECDNKEHIVACLQGDLSLNLKALASFAGVKRCELLPLKKLTKITGYVRGGCSPLAMKKKFRTFIDERVLMRDKVFVSAGIRGKQLYLEPRALLSATNGTLCYICL